MDLRNNINTVIDTVIDDAIYEGVLLGIEVSRGIINKKELDSVAMKKELALKLKGKYRIPSPEEEAENGNVQ